MIKYNFYDNQTVGADDLNGIIKKFYPLPGLKDPFVDGRAYYAATLNNIVGGALQRGVVPEAERGLKVSRNADGEYIVSEGTAIFANGQTAELTEPETVSVPSGQRSYIYIVADAAQNKAYLTAETSPATDAPGVAYYVPLAEVAADGTVASARIYATLAGATNDAAKHFVITVPLKEYLTPNSSGQYTGTFSESYDLGGSNYNLLIMRPSAVSMTLMQKEGGVWTYECYAHGSSDDRRKYYDRAVWHTGVGWQGCTVESAGGNIKINYTATRVTKSEPTFDLWALAAKTAE